MKHKNEAIVKYCTAKSMHTVPLGTKSDDAVVVATVPFCLLSVFVISTA